MNIKICSIEGCIGSGKSTLLEILKKYYINDSEIVFIDEPVKEWESVKDETGNTMLQKFYNDKEKYSFPFQMMAGFTLLKAIKTAINNNPEAKIFITERSLQTTRYVFAQMLYDSKFIEDVNMQIYKLWFETFADEYLVSQIIYVKTTPEICNQRIIQRSRIGEDSISLKYLVTCDNYHEVNLMPMFPKESILVLNGNLNIHDKDIATNVINQINTFIK